MVGADGVLFDNKARVRLVVGWVSQYKTVGLVFSLFYFIFSAEFKEIEQIKFERFQSE